MPVNAPNFASALATPQLHGPHLAAAAVLAALFFGLLGHALRKTRSTDALTAIGWWAAGAVAAGAGLWALQFFPLTGLGLPWSVSFRGWVVAGAGLVALTGMLLVMASARLSWADTTRQTVQGLGVGALWAVLQAMALASLGDQPIVRGATAVLAWAGLPVALVAAAALAGLWVAFNARWAAMGPFPLRLWVGAVGFGLVSGLAQALALGGLGFEESARPVGVLLIGENALELACGAGAVALLLGLFGALIDTRASSRNRELASSLSEANRRLREQALSDPLTRLPNRLLFEERLEAALERVDAPNAGDAALAVMFIDLDGFKPVNDSFGHTAGDAVLREVGQRLHNLARQSDVVARVGGDEFLLLAERPGGEAGASQVAQRVLQAVAKPYRLPNGAEVHLSCSIGIVMYPENGPSPKLLANADAAMYAAKRAGGAGFAFFDPSMEHDARAQLELQHDLRGAIDRNELVLYYQPKVDGRSGQVTGVEALVRWQHPVRGMVAPGVFIPVAERFGLIGALGQWVIDEACRQVREWTSHGLRMRVSINLSAHQLRQENLVQRLRQSIQAHDIDPSLLTLEIVESVLMEEAAVRAFSGLAQLGVTLSIDDLGIGYCNFALLRKLPVTQLKVDRSLFSDIQHSADALAVVDAIVKMAHALGLRVVAEGVETDAQHDMLLALRCDELQGFLYAKPMAADRLTLWAMGEDGLHGPDFRPSIYAAASPTLQ